MTVNRIVALIFLGVVVAVKVSGVSPRMEPVKAAPAPVTKVETVKRLQPHEPHPGDSEAVTDARADYAAHCLGSEPVGYSKQMCDQLLHAINKIDLARSLLGITCKLGGSQSYACRDELASHR